MGIARICLPIAEQVQKNPNKNKTGGTYVTLTRAAHAGDRTFWRILPARFTRGARRWRRGPCAPRVSPWGALEATPSLCQGEGKLSTKAGEEGGQETEPAQAKERLQFPAPRPAGYGGWQRMREARPPIPLAREGGPRRPRDCEPLRDPSARRGAAAPGRAGLRRRPSGAWSAGREGPPAPLWEGLGARSPPRRRGMREFRPGPRAGCGSRTKAGRRGRSWGRRAGGRCRSPSLGRASGVGNFLCNFCKREDNSASDCTAPGRPRSHEQRGGDTAAFPGWAATPSSAEVVRRGAPGRGRIGMPEVRARVRCVR